LGFRRSTRFWSPSDRVITHGDITGWQHATADKPLTSANTIA
jgi:hypothetical protein